MQLSGIADQSRRSCRWGERQTRPANDRVSAGEQRGYCGSGRTSVGSSPGGSRIQPAPLGFLMKSVAGALAWRMFHPLPSFIGITNEADSPGRCSTYSPFLSAVSYTHLRAHETGRNLVCRLLLEKK